MPISATGIRILHLIGDRDEHVAPRVAFPDVDERGFMRRVVEQLDDLILSIVVVRPHGRQRGQRARMVELPPTMWRGMLA